MSAPSPALDAAHRQAVAAHLEAFASATTGLRAAVIASVDGFALVQSAPGAGNGERLAAMTSAMLALAGAVGRELALGALEVLILEAAEGKVLMLSIPAPQAPLLLMAACERNSLTGSVLWSAKECGQKVLAELDGG